MKPRLSLLCSFCFFCFSFINSAQAEDSGNQIKIQEKTGDGDKTIVIKKGAQESTDPDFEIVSGTTDISGDPAPTSKEARLNWKAACKDWKTEMKEMNKDNHLIVLDCRSPKKQMEGTMTVFNSEGFYKLKTRIRLSK